MSNSVFTVAEDQKTLVVSRTFHASVDKVWAAYSEADKLEKWWGPAGWETEVKEMDFRVGGHWFYCMTCRDESQGEWFGKSSCGKGVYEAIDPKKSFCYIDYFTDDEGVVTPGMPTSKTTVELTEENGSTTVVSSSEFENAEALKQVMEMGMEQGFDQTWDNLERYLTQQ